MTSSETEINTETQSHSYYQDRDKPGRVDTHLTGYRRVCRAVKLLNKFRECEGKFIDLVPPWCMSLVQSQRNLFTSKTTFSQTSLL